MPRRIHEAYQPGDTVEIIFSHLGEDTWRAAVVLRTEPPGIWVETTDGRQWFMTNTYRIRPVAGDAGTAADAVTQNP